MNDYPRYVKPKRKNYFVIVPLLILLVAFGFFVYKATRVPEFVQGFNDQGLRDDISICDVLDQEENNNYYYSLLNDYEKKVYKTFLYYSYYFEPSFFFNYEYDSESFTNARFAFSKDYPEYYWWDSLYCQKTTEYNLFHHYEYYCIKSSQTSKDILEANYNAIFNEAILIAEECSNIENFYNMNRKQYKNYNDFYNIYFEKCYITNVHNWLVQNIEYDKNVDNDQNIQSVFLSRKSVCSGYSEAFKYLLDLKGIPCIVVEGDGITYNSETQEYETEKHEWNIVLINNKYYYVDVTWDETDDFNIDYSNFLIGKDVFDLTHIADNRFVIMEVEKNTDPNLRDYIKDSYTIVFGAEDKAEPLVRLKEEIRSAIYSYMNPKLANFYLYFESTEDFDKVLNWLSNGGFNQYYGTLYDYYSITTQYTYNQSTQIITIHFDDTYH